MRVRFFFDVAYIYTNEVVLFEPIFLFWAYSILSISAKFS